MDRITRLCEIKQDEEHKYALHTIGNYNGIYKDTSFGNAIDKLAEYENLEEQGLLLKPPCKLNDIVWVIGTKCFSGNYKKECSNYRNDKYFCPCNLNEEYMVFSRVVKEQLLMDLIFKRNKNFIFGENVFLTKEDAEQKMKEQYEKD